jgi:hypothetical protein
VNERIPIAYFAYNRPFHTKRSLDLLGATKGFSGFRLVIHCDGPSGEETEALRQTRAIAESFAKTTGASLVLRDHNLGLAASIRSGVGELCNTHGRVVVLEDDILVAPSFLQYMRQALQQYEKNESVMQISGHSHIQRNPDGFDGYLAPLSTTWGWATWSRAWNSCDWDAAESASHSLRSDPRLRHRFDLSDAYPYSRLLEDQRAGSIDSWGILWWWHVFMRNGLVLYPNRSLVANAGEDGSGIHSRRRRLKAVDAPAEQDQTEWRFPTVDVVDPEVLDDIRAALATGALRRRGLRHGAATLERLARRVGR